MGRPVHYVLAVLFAGTLTALVALTTRSVTILLGIFVTYALTAAICVRYPILVWGDAVPSVPSGVFGGGATFGGMMLGSAVGGDFTFGAAMLGLGLAGFGLATGYWMADSSDGSPAKSVDTEA
ncbi:hypothetical protein EGH22_00310 [Halomicroarcula sp. F28]|uniref:hypothetical protein n=1 Tax=Haloarcula salinisoli TaxID=2487746 RepID=UPI001C72E68B|nr:hypothetical protein [Halomicroarcula salinisoli]MBX0284757.1 hypothetical protein [Halomicroarcula salinisoli]